MEEDWRARLRGTHGATFGLLVDHEICGFSTIMRHSTGAEQRRRPTPELLRPAERAAPDGEEVLAIPQHGHRGEWDPRPVGQHDELDLVVDVEGRGQDHEVVDVALGRGV